MSNKRAKTGTNEVGSSSSNFIVRAFFTTLPSPLRIILEKIDEAMEMEPLKRKWPAKNEFTVAHKLLVKQGECTKDYLKAIFLPAWEEAKRSWITVENTETMESPEEIITFRDLVNKFNSGKSQNITKSSLRMRVLQRWGIKTSVNPTQPVCFLMKEDSTESDVIVMKIFCSKKGRGSFNYKLMAELPFGGEISIHEFQIMQNRREFIVENFVKIEKEFEINATNSFISIIPIEGPPKVIGLTMVQLSYMRLKTRVEAEIEVITTPENIEEAREPVKQFVAWSGNTVDRWTIDIYDTQASLGKLTFWERLDEVKALRKIKQLDEVTLRIVMPSSIKVIDDVLIVVVGAGTVVHIAK